MKGKWNAPQPIMQAFHSLMGQPKKRKNPDGMTVAEVFEKFLDWCQTH